MLKLDKMDSFADRRKVLSEFLAEAKKPGAICWGIHALMDTWVEAIVAEDPQAVHLELLLAENREKFQHGHRARARRSKLVIRDITDPDLLMEGGAEMIRDTGDVVVLVLVSGMPPQTFYRT